MRTRWYMHTQNMTVEAHTWDVILAVDLVEFDCVVLIFSDVDFFSFLIQLATVYVGVTFHVKHSAAALRLCGHTSLFYSVTPAHCGQCACVCSLAWISIARSSHMTIASSVPAALGSFYGECETGMTKQQPAKCSCYLNWFQFLQTVLKRGLPD